MMSTRNAAPRPGRAPASPGFAPLLIVLWLAAVAPLLPAQQEDELYGVDVVAAERYLTRGELARAAALYDEVLADWEDLQGTSDAPLESTVHACRIGLARIALRQGRYADVVERIDLLPEAARRRPDSVAVLSDALFATGRYARAERELDAALGRSAAGDASAGDPSAGDASAAVLGLRLRRGRLLAETGRRAAARAEFEELIASAEAAGVGDAEALSHVGRAHFELGGRRHVVAASTAARDAIRADPDLAAPRILYARLRFVAYGEWSGAESGESLLKEVLERNGDVEEALLLLYQIRSINIRLDPAQTAEYLERALQVNPRSVPGLLAKGISQLDERRFAAGAQTLDSALEINPRAKDVLAQRAVAAHLRGDDDAARSFRERALAVDAGYAGVDRAFGDRLVELYRFGDAVPYYQAALETRPEDVDALEGLAKAQLYSGRGERAAEILRRAKSLEPGYVDPWRNNVIAVQELLDEEYERVDAEGFLFLLHRDDREVLERYLVPFHQEARRVLGEKYGLVPEEQVRVEVFHTWDDFSVRTIGFRGFTALGACFGPMITLVSPVDTDLRRNDFMWTATVWHEYTHVLTLALSDHRVPRWLTEGFSVHEERARNDTWERGMVRDLLDAWHNGQIPPLRLMNRLFRGPRILFGYYLGGEIVTYLAEEHGFEDVVRMLRAYARDESTEEVFENTFGYDSETFDERFRAWLWDTYLERLRIVPRFDEQTIQRKLVEVARDPDDLDTHVQLAWAFVQRGVAVDAATHVRAVLRRDPDHPGIQLVRAEILRREGRPEDAVELYERGFAGGADDFDSRRHYAELLLARGDSDGAIQQLLAAKRCWPRCTEQQSAPELLLARIYDQLGRRTEAMMELRTFCQRTARAFQPRLKLAEFARESGDRAQEAELLWEAVQIDPFVRQVHLDLGEAYVELGRLQDAVREFEVALAVVPELDRQQQGQAPTAALRSDSPEFLESQGAVRVRLAEVLRRVGREQKARAVLEQVLRTVPDGDAAARARELLDR